MLYFPTNKFLPNFCGKDGITFEMKTLCHMLLTDNVCKIFFCTLEKMVVSSACHFFLRSCLKHLSVLIGLYFFQKMSSRSSSIEVSFCLPYIAQVNFSLALKVVWTSPSLGNGPFKTELLLHVQLSFVIVEVEICFCT